MRLRPKSRPSLDGRDDAQGRARRRRARSRSADGGSRPAPRRDAGSRPKRIRPRRRPWVTMKPSFAPGDDASRGRPRQRAGWAGGGAGWRRRGSRRRLERTAAPRASRRPTLTGRPPGSRAAPRPTHQPPRRRHRLVTPRECCADIIFYNQLLNRVIAPMQDAARCLAPALAIGNPWITLRHRGSWGTPRHRNPWVTPNHRNPRVTLRAFRAASPAGPSRPRPPRRPSAPAPGRRAG